MTEITLMTESDLDQVTEIERASFDLEPWSRDAF